MATQFPNIYEIARSKDLKVHDLYKFNGVLVEWDIRNSKPLDRTAIGRPLEPYVTA